MDKRKYLYVIRVSDMSVNQIDITGMKHTTYQRILAQFGFNEKECSYIRSDREITEINDINILN